MNVRHKDLNKLYKHNYSYMSPHKLVSLLNFLQACSLVALICLHTTLPTLAMEELIAWRILP